MEKLKELREARKLSQQTVANYLGITRQAYSNYEISKREPDNSTLKRLATYFGVSTDYLLGNNSSEPVLSSRDERDIQRRLSAALGDLESSQSALMFDGEPLDDETKELLIASLERTIRQAKIMAKEKYTPKKYRNKGSDKNEGGSIDNK